MFTSDLFLDSKSKKCNETAKGVICPKHGLKECPGYSTPMVESNNSKKIIETRFYFKPVATSNNVLIESFNMKKDPKGWFLSSIDPVKFHYDAIRAFGKPYITENHILSEDKQGTLTIFDIDDTLLHTTAKIKVIKNDKVIKTLTNQEFNNYTLGPDETFDFAEFRDANKFKNESKPIRRMIERLLTDIAKAKGQDKVIMLTARADFDNKETFLDTFRKLKIPVNKVHIHRAGNLEGNASPAEKKAVFVRDYLNTGKYNEVHLYDDSNKNLEVFKSLKNEYPDVKFMAWKVHPTGKADTVESNKNNEGYDLAGFSGSTGIIGDDNFTSPVGSVPSNQK